jgi:two-component system, NarL family, invasion response regulator UvrY
MTKLYLIEDHQMVREGLHVLLRAAGHQVIGEAADAAVGIREVLELAPDVVLLDMMLYENSGLFFLAEMHRRKTLIKTIVLTMSSQPPHLWEALRLGAKGYVLKGSSSAELLHAIDRVVIGEIFVSASMQGAQKLRTSPATSNDDLLAELSVRERQIMEFVVRGKTSADIATLVFLSPKTVDTYRSRLMRKLNVEDVTGLVRFAVRCGIIDSVF